MDTIVTIAPVAATVPFCSPLSWLIAIFPFFALFLSWSIFVYGGQRCAEFQAVLVQRSVALSTAASFFFIGTIPSQKQSMLCFLFIFASFVIHFWIAFAHNVESVHLSGASPLRDLQDFPIQHRVAVDFVEPSRDLQEFPIQHRVAVDFAEPVYFAGAAPSRDLQEFPIQHRVAVDFAEPVYFAGAAPSRDLQEFPIQHRVAVDFAKSIHFAGAAPSQDLQEILIPTVLLLISPNPFILLVLRRWETSKRS